MLEKIGFVLQRYNLRLYYTENRSVSPPSSAALVSLQLTQFWERPADGFTRPARLLRWHRSGGIDGSGKDGSTSVKSIKEPLDLGDGVKSLRRIELSERAHSLDQGNLGPAHPREGRARLAR